MKKILIALILTFLTSTAAWAAIVQSQQALQYNTESGGGGGVSSGLATATSCSTGKAYNSVSGYCTPCSVMPGCKACYFISNSLKCTSCGTGYTLSNAVCVTCSAGQYVSGGSCASCSAGTYSTGGTVTSCTKSTTVANCSTYSTTSDACTKCNAGYFPNDNGAPCTGCGAGTYSDDGLSCKACPNATYSGNGASSCTAHTVTNCATYSTYTDACTACNSGYTLSNGKCVASTVCSGRTPDARTQSDGSIKCSCSGDSCGTGASCIRHPKYNSKTLVNNYSVCVCLSGYYDNGNGCSACPTGCSSCSSASVCTACASGYQLSAGKCIKDTATTCPTGTNLSTDGCCCVNA